VLYYSVRVTCVTGLWGALKFVTHTCNSVT